MRRHKRLPGTGMLYFFSQRVSLTICLYFEMCNMGGKPVMKRDELAGGYGAARNASMLLIPRSRLL